MSNALFQFSSARLGYPGHVTLADLTLSVCTGDFIGIVGPNGSGKSTLVKTMLGLLPLRGGQMSWPAGRPVIGYVPQRERIDPIWPMRVRDLLQLTLSALEPPRLRPHREDARVQQVMQATGIQAIADQHLDTLSGGEMQRLLLARALVVQPRVLFLDEPTAAMDLFASERFMEMIAQLHRDSGITVILVTHDLQALAGRAGTVGILAAGDLHHGPTSEMLTAARLSQVYGHPIDIHPVGDRLFIQPQHETGAASS